MTKDTEERLDSQLRAVADGDMDALGELYTETRSSIFGFSLSIVRDPSDAEDVTHDVYVSVATSANKYSGGKPMAWLLTIAKNLSLSVLRRRKTVELPDDMWERYHPDSTELTTDDRMILSECVSALSDEERQIVMLHAAAGYRHREIAGFMNLPLSTVLSKYNRAMRKLRASLTENNDAK